MFYSTSVGLDVHARSITAAALVLETGEIIERSFSYEPDSLADWIKTLPRPVHCVYESGPTGFHLRRRLETHGIACVIGAVTKMLRPTGDKVKNDKRDAIFLARMLAVGNIVEVYIPDPEEEAARDLARAREDVRHDLTRAKQLLSKFLLRKGIVYEKGKSAWTKTHRRWLNSLVFDNENECLVMEEYLMAIAEEERRRDRLDEKIKAMAQKPRFRRTVANLCCLRGISTVSSFAIAVEIGDFTRFKKARSFVSYLGLHPSLNESGESSSSGKITKTGNSHVRRLLVEAAWHHARLYCPSADGLQAGYASVCCEAAQLAKKANARLHERAVYLKKRRLNPCKANTAVARELAGFVWALALAKVDA